MQPDLKTVNKLQTQYLNSQHSPPRGYEPTSRVQIENVSGSCLSSDHRSEHQQRLVKPKGRQFEHEMLAHQLLGVVCMVRMFVLLK